MSVGDVFGAWLPVGHIVNGHIVRIGGGEHAPNVLVHLEALEESVLIANGTSPCSLFRVELQVRFQIETLKANNGNGHSS